MAGQSPEIVVRGGTVVTPDGRFDADLGIRDGRICEVGTAVPPAPTEIDARGLLVLPGLVDAHVHFRDPGMTYKEDFGSGSRAAAVGGVTTVFDMPNTVPPVSTAQIHADKIATVAPKAHVDFGIYGMLGQANADEIAGFAAQGAPGLKLFMGQTTGDNPCPDDGAIYAGLVEAAKAGLVVGVHAENNPLLQQLARELRAQGRTDTRAHLESRPDVVEVEAVTRIITLAGAAGVQLHIHHLSTEAGLARVRLMRALGHRVSVETLVGHLLLDDEAYEEFGNLVKLNPPIRPRENVDALWAGVTAGEVDIIATDHAPHSVEEQGAADVWCAHGGWIGVETMLPLLLTQAAEGRLSVSDIVRLCSATPAKLWHIDDRKGHLGIGGDADFVLVDEHAAGTVVQQKLHSMHPITPFDGWSTVGAVRATYLRGSLIAADGEPVGTPSGRQVTPIRHRDQLGV
ncbi:MULTISPECIES: allantoinase AllB [Gordonia]|uniref:allantoinase n=1 Tax=Gordonia alkanivorans NBRC 16433 TaxID=1027371 RepID=F9VRX7_9ACTN|nr:MULTISPECIES: allantoinase AllB [Gordonia]MDH3020531.1 allantoinase AllB [Gordonia alkanivorans]MDH3049390.1 allantoinase AllB [Gordonia alkanivorans]MDJ0007297.1 allantoinase AllB [Gordonia alkanivorans]MDJ0027686.1 allantoinase AllB [Gordonia alkanivorans]MDJ0098390.1 allantoinase AllB [Gordonia alkanivorans]